MLQQKKNNKGFTIIEVLIVLAIAGLIMLVIFLAVPALQRNSRNNTYKTDAANLVGAAVEFSSNSNGKVPVTADSASIFALTKAKSITAIQVGSGVTARTPTFDSAWIITGAKCPATVGTASITPDAASTRSMLIIYAVENASGGVSSQCIDS